MIETGSNREAHAPGEHGPAGFDSIEAGDCVSSNQCEHFHQTERECHAQRPADKSDQQALGCDLAKQPQASDA